MASTQDTHTRISVIEEGKKEGDTGKKPSVSLVVCFTSILYLHGLLFTNLFLSLPPLPLPLLLLPPLLLATPPMSVASFLSTCHSLLYYKYWTPRISPHSSNRVRRSVECRTGRLVKTGNGLGPARSEGGREGGREGEETEFNKQREREVKDTYWG